jgi:N-acetylglutamate synthase-like GNAT family acetyltransferase
MIKQLELGDINNLLSILKQDSLRSEEGTYLTRESALNFITDSECFAFGLYEEGSILVSVLLAERLSFDGCMLWYIATDSTKQGNGYGSQLLNHFESHVKEIGIEWIFLNATENSLKFYAKHNFKTSNFSKVYEHTKYL